MPPASTPRSTPLPASSPGPRVPDLVHRRSARATAHPHGGLRPQSRPPPTSASPLPIHSADATPSPIAWISGLVVGSLRRCRRRRQRRRWCWSPCCASSRGRSSGPQTRRRRRSPIGRSRICIGARELLHSGPRSGLPRTAVKILVKKKVQKHRLVELIRREICTMKLIQHPNVRLYEVMGSKTRIYIVLEFVMGGDLHDIVATGGRLKEDEARTYFQQLINVVDYCNSRGVYHIDLKVQAVFILDSVLDLAK